eukprot:TRINITY_DN611_c0_g2_i3.p1 TRINITY_DN611_c0_g2~~TRINITY_DN611_c0_g2_i3.p1  ORF type:complete len:196 (+),score=68.04 TRINITY_DN611_c0_g2_i3:200-787(+)
MKAVQTNIRKQKDIASLMMSKYVVMHDSDRTDELTIIFCGPKGTEYEGGVWKVGVYLPEQYPYKSPSVGFRTRIFHPNIDEKSGTICLDVLNQTWTPLFELQHIFDVFLPQLLLYPNAKDPLNSSAAQLLLSEPAEYKVKVREYVKKYASDPELLARAEKQIEETVKESKKEEKVNEDDSELSETSLKSDDEGKE